MKRVLLISSAHLLGQGVESLLTREEDLHVVRASLHDGISNLVQTIGQFQPQIVILEEPRDVEDTQPVFRLLKEYRELCVIVVNKHDNYLQVYNKKEVVVAHSEDLISMVRMHTGLSCDY